MRRLIGFMVLAALALLLGGALRAQEFGTNWTATFYPSTDFTGTGVPVALTGGINFNWGQAAPSVNGVFPLGATQIDNFSARFTTTQNFNSGTYRFTVVFDDRVRVLIDGQEALNGQLNAGDISPKTQTFDRELTAGAHTLTVEYIEFSENAVIQFQWGLITGGGVVQPPAPGQPIPSVPTATPVPPLTVSISTAVRGLAVRTGPYLGASLVAVAQPGEAYPVLARNPSEDGITWYQITVGESTGWASGRYLVFSTEQAPVGLGIQGSIFDQLDGAPDTGVTGSTRSVMNMRARPSQRTALLAQIPWGATVPVLNRTVRGPGGGDFWYQVRYEGQVGWIFAPYVTLNGSRSAVPVR